MSITKDVPVNDAIREDFSRFFDGVPVRADIIDTSRGDADIRNTIIITTEDGEKHVLKVVSNDFTFPEKIRMWQRTIEEYIDLGYYCPRIICDKNGEFPGFEEDGHTFVIYGEEFSKYRSLEDRAAKNEDAPGVSNVAYMKEIWSMTAKIAAKKLDYTDHPSAYCLFDTFCPSDPVDEVLEVALEWKKAADALPEEFSGQAKRIWDRWCRNREELEPLYAKLPTSVFQADLNSSNLLVDEAGSFMGVCDFNLCGKDVFLNYLIRENHDDFEEEIRMIREALRISCEYYDFTEEEKAAALPLYRCLKPLWYARVDELKKAGNDAEKIRNCLDRIEYYQTADIDLASCMDRRGAREEREERRETEEIVIRTLTEKEIPAWLSFLQNEIFPEDSPEDVMSIWESDRSKDPKGIFAAADTEGSIIGSVKAECREMVFQGSPVLTGIISGVGIRKEYRGLGIGGRLFAWCHEYLKKRGAGLAYLYSEPDTLSFYRHLGYMDCRKDPEVSYYRMFRLIRPFEAGGRQMTCTKDFIEWMDAPPAECLQSEQGLEAADGAKE